MKFNKVEICGVNTSKLPVLSKKEKEGLVEYTDTDLPRSFIISHEKRGDVVRLSRISPIGLKIRIEKEENY